MSSNIKDSKLVSDKKIVLDDNKQNLILNRQKNQWNKVFLDDWVIPTTWESVSINEMKWLQFSKAVRYKNKKIYFNSDGTEIKIGYDDETGVGFVEIVSE